MKHTACYLRLLALIAAGLLLGKGVLRGQNPENVENQVGKFLSRAAQMSQENVYVHTDRQSCFSGDSLWFSLYVVDQRFHMPTAWSSVAYLDLLDAAGEKVGSVPVKLNKGKGQGTVKIPDHSPTGSYFLCGYTRWMLNAGSENLSIQPLLVIQPEEGVPDADVKQLAPLDIAFFPEGGQWITGRESRVTFRLIGGRPATAVTGEIVDDLGQAKGNVSAPMAGMGEFFLTPDSGRSYFFVPTDMEGMSTRPFPLPDVNPQGLSLRVDPADGGFQVKVHLVQPGTPALHLIAHANDWIYESMPVPLQGDSAEWLLSHTQLGEGINVLTFLNPAGQVLAERLIFNPARDELTTRMQANGQVFGRRREVIIDLEVADAAGQPVQADFSVSVSLEDPLQVNPLSLPTQMALRGVAYASDGRPELADSRQMDLWLRANPPEAIRWNQLMANAEKTPTLVPELYGPVITGKVLDPETGKTVEAARVYLSVPGPSAQISVAQSDPDGGFLLTVPEGARGSELVFRSESPSGKACEVELSPLPELEAAFLPESPSWPQDARSRLESGFLHRQVREAYAPFRAQDIRTARQVARNPFYEKADVIYELDEFTRFTTEETFVEIAYLVSLRKKQGKFFFRVIDPLIGIPFTEEPLMLIDGVPVSQADEIIALSPRQLQRIEVVTSRYFKGPVAFEGIVHAVTYAGDAQTVKRNGGTQWVPYDFPRSQPHFPSLSYASEAETASRLPDFREGLHWAPSVTTDAEGKAQLRFFTSDATGRYLVRAEGLSATGHMAHATMWIEVGKEE